jgi:hypothetical protein
MVRLWRLSDVGLPTLDVRMQLMSKPKLKDVRMLVG